MQTNVLAVSERAGSVEDFETTFGGKRLIEVVYFFNEDGSLNPPLDGIVIVEGSSAHKLYVKHGVEVQTRPAKELLAEGFCNPFLLKLGTPAESALVADLRARLAAGVEVPKPKVNIPLDSWAPAAPTQPDVPRQLPPGRAAGDDPTERLGSGDPRYGTPEQYRKPRQGRRIRP